MGHVFRRGGGGAGAPNRLSHKTKRGDMSGMIVWRSLVAWILVDTKIQQENLKNLGRGAKEINLGG